jgi:YD repeat-containing protein
LMQAGEYSVTSGGMAPALNATCSDTNVWCEKYGFDGYGSRSISNRSGLTAALNEPSLFGPTTNQVMNAGWVYDEAGNVTTDGGQGSLNTASHDGDNRLVSPGTASGVSYGYDAEGRRVRRTVSGVPTTFVYGADGELAAEYGGTVTATGRQYVTVDQLGTTRVVTDGNGRRVLEQDSSYTQSVLYVNDANGEVAAEYSTGSPYRQSGSPPTRAYVSVHSLGSTRVTVATTGQFVAGSGFIQRFDYLPFGLELGAMGLPPVVRGLGDMGRAGRRCSLGVRNRIG